MVLVRPETDGLGAGSCLSGRQTTVSTVYTDFLFFCSWLTDSWLQFLTLFCCHDSENCDSYSHSGAVLPLTRPRPGPCIPRPKEREVHAALQYAASFHCLVEEWKDCEELKPKPKEKKFRGQDEEGKETSIRMVCPGQQESMCEVEGVASTRRCQESVRDRSICPQIGENGERGNIDLVQEMLRLCKAENGTNIAELLQARASGHQGTWQDVETNPGS